MNVTGIDGFVSYLFKIVQIIKVYMHNQITQLLIIAYFLYQYIFGTVSFVIFITLLAYEHLLLDKNKMHVERMDYITKNQL